MHLKAFATSDVCGASFFQRGNHGILQRYLYPFLFAAMGVGGPDRIVRVQIVREMDGWQWQMAGKQRDGNWDGPGGEGGGRRGGRGRGRSGGGGGRGWGGGGGGGRSGGGGGGGGGEGGKMNYQQKQGLKFTKVVPKFLQAFVNANQPKSAKSDGGKERPNSVRRSHFFITAAVCTGAAPPPHAMQ